MILRSILALATAVFCLIGVGAHAQLRPGQDYTLLSPAQPTEGGGKVEVIEFFSYACGHCYKLEPFLEAWKNKLPADVIFRRVPGAGSDAWSQLALLYYSLEAMGQLDRLNKKVFDAIHLDRENLANPKVRVAWLGKQGIDATQYQAVEKSFSVQSKLQRARQLMGAYKIDGVPTLVVNGKYVTSNSHAGGPERVVPVVEALIAMARKEVGAAEPPKQPPAPARK
jgi:protein dithiol oxidoreductase (disulfide-forming)